MSLLPVEDAIAAILARVRPPRAERVRLDQADGRVLAQAVVAEHNQPPFNASAMDGYAVRSGDIVPGHRLRLTGTSQAGAGFAGAVGAGETVRIFTGAPVPDGADAVVMQEDASLVDGFVSLSSQPSPGRSIRPIGNDFKSGQVLIPSRTRLNPFTLALAAAANQADVTVTVRPRIGILATGDELVMPGTPLQPGQIVASNSFGLTPLLAPYAGEIIDFGIAKDDRSALAGKLQRAFDAEVDILVTTGGASVGEHDIVQDVLKSLGVELDFWRINMRPGKPLMFGTRGKTLVFGLPGNPVSAMVTATVFIKPALRRWLGLVETEHRPFRLPLAEATPPNTARRHFMRARLLRQATGLAALPIKETDSGHTSSLGLADLLIVQAEHDPGRSIGTLVDCIELAAF